MRKIKKWLLSMSVLLLALTIMPCEKVQAAVAVETPQLTAAYAGTMKGSVQWKEVRGASGYRVYRKIDGKSWRTMKTISGSKNAFYEDNNMRPGTCYVYTVRAYKRVNGKTIWSKYDKNGIRVVTGLMTPVFTVKKSNTKENTVKITINDVSGARGYYIYRRNSLTDKWSRIGETTKNYFYDTKAVSGHTYLYTVKAYCIHNGKKYYSSYHKKGISCKVMKLNPYFQKVKDYVLEKGYTDTDGNKYVPDTVKVDDAKFEWRIKYDKREDQLVCQMTTDCKDYNDKIYIVLDENVSYVRTQYYFYVGDFMLDAGTKLNAGTYTGKRDVEFEIRVSDADVDISYEEGNELANEVLKLAFAGWEEMLNARVKVSLKQLGFPAYAGV